MPSRSSQRADDAAASAFAEVQRDAVAGMAYSREAMEQHAHDVSMFPDARFALLYTVLRAFYLSDTSATQAAATRLVWFIQQNTEVAALFDGSILKVEDIPGMFAPGPSAAMLLESNLAVLREGRDRREVTSLLADIDRLPLAEKAEALENAAAKLRQQQVGTGIVSIRDLMRDNPELDPPVVENIVRSGEVMNIISKSKVGKSWLVYGMALSIAAGILWLGKFACRRGKVLIIDNELKKPVLASRLPAVALAMGLRDSEWLGRIDVRSLRGQQRDITQLGDILNRSIRGVYSMVFLDAGYKFVPQGWDENSNADMSRFYTYLDKYSDDTGATVSNVVHATKGSQTGKAVTDVGAGAGAISRSPDSHLIFREHEQPGISVMECALRSFPPLDPVPVRFTFPVWTIAEDVDASQLKGTKQARDNEVANAKIEARRKKIVAFLGEPDVRKSGATRSAIKDGAGVSTGLLEALRSLVKDGNLETCEITHPRNKTVSDGWRIKPDPESQPDSRTQPDSRNQSVNPGAEGMQADGRIPKGNPSVCQQTALSEQKKTQSGYSPEDDRTNQRPNGKRSRKTARKTPA